MKLAPLVLCILLVAASARAEAQATCDGTRAVVRVTSAPDYISCGTLGLTEAVFELNLERVIQGPNVPVRFLGIVSCPPPWMGVGRILEACIGPPRMPTGDSLFDTFQRPPYAAIQILVDRGVIEHRRRRFRRRVPVPGR